MLTVTYHFCFCYASELLPPNDESDNKFPSAVDHSQKLRLDPPLAVNMTARSHVRNFYRLLSCTLHHCCLLLIFTRITFTFRSQSDFTAGIFSLPPT